MSFLNPSVWLAALLALCAAFGAGYFKGAHGVRYEWNETKLDGLREVRRIENRRVDRAAEAAVLASAAAQRIRTDADLARAAVDGLRDDIAALQRAGAQSIDAANQRAVTAEKLLLDSAGAYRELAQKADGHASDVKLLQDAWPR